MTLPHLDLEPQVDGPVFRPPDARIPLSRPDISEEDIESIVEVLRTPYLSLGPKLSEFEAEFAAYTGARFATATNSGTSALHLAVRALGIGEGDEVITSPFSFVASANCMLFEQAVPVFADIDPTTFNLDPEGIERCITPRTKAILPVHVFGRPANMDAVLEIARTHHLHVVEDACEALGARWRGRAVGTLGDSGTFAFYPNKQMTTGEGGMVVTNDASLDRLHKSMRNQGRGTTGEWLQHERIGFNYRLSEINCALGLSQLGRISQILERRQAVAEEYRRQLSGIERLEQPVFDSPHAEISWFVYVVRLKDATREERDGLLAQLRSEGIACSDYFSPLHLQPHLRRAGFGEGAFPVTEAVAASTVALPFYNALQSDQIRQVADALRRALCHRTGPSIAHPVRRSVL